MQTCRLEPCFLADGMLGRLARWLRLLGYDTEYDNHASDLELARRARAEGRVLLTRDRALAARRGLQTLLIDSERLEEQVRQVVETFGWPADAALSRCACCNVPLEEVEPEAVRELVPPHVLRTQRRFWLCRGCGRVYWQGSHVDSIRRRLGELKNDEPHHR